MKDETFHINVSLELTDSHSISVVKTRLWSFQLMSLNWLVRSPISTSTNVRNGLGLIVLNTLATSIEGLITDLIGEHLFEKDLERVDEMKKLRLGGWREKKIKYNKLFNKKIETYNSYDSIETLFSLRNNISHGETHLEISKRENATGTTSKIESVTKSYEKVRRFLILKGIIDEAEISSNAKVLWTWQISVFFYSETQLFLKSVVAENESPKKMGVQEEFRTVLANSY